VGVPDLSAVADRIESLLDELPSATDAPVWSRVEELVRLLTELYGAALARTVELAEGHPDLIARLGRDELVGSLLVLHDLHPDSLEQRATRAIDSVAPLLRKGGASAEVTNLDTEAASVGVTVTAPGGGCGSTAEALCDTVRRALDDAAPDAAIEVTLAVDTTPAPTPVRLGRKPVGATQGP
jgi:Fe-S cluster biogenesis protein NfuA